MAKVLLKARPTPAQLADRLRPPWPDGLELYLDAADLADGAFAATVERLRAAEVPAGFRWLIEGPVGSLDGGYFDLAADRPADREVVRRLVELGRAIDARAINVHLIAPGPDPRRLTPGERAVGLRRAVELARRLVDLAAGAGIVATVENMPPVLRQRGSLFWFTPIGLAADDLLELAARTPGLRVCLDLSHAGLYVHARRLADLGATGEFPELLAFLRSLPPVGSVAEYAEPLGGLLRTCHVSNARGLLGEGLAYDEGDLDLDEEARRLAGRVEDFVTETLEPDPDRAENMRVAQARLRAALARAAGRGRVA